MMLAFDTYYYNNKAKTIAVSFKDWQDQEPTEIYSEIIEGIADYEPGSFYKRELPCILSLLKKINSEEINLIIVDSFVLLDDQGKLGLGGHLFEKLNQRPKSTSYASENIFSFRDRSRDIKPTGGNGKIPVIGVAKSGFHANELNSRALLRGDSTRPLYISAMGIDLDLASNHIKSMHGNFRMPTLLQIVDTKTKEK